MSLDPTSLDDTQPTYPVKSIRLRRFQFNFKTLRWFIGVSLIVSIFLFAGVFIIVTSIDFEPTTVHLKIDDETYTLSSHQPTVGDLLDEHGVIIESGDLLTPNRATALREDMLIHIVRARTVSVTVDGRTSILRTTFNNPQDILNSTGIVLSSSDQITIDGQSADRAALMTWPEAANHITIRSAVEVTLIDGDALITMQTTGSTVGDVLFEAGIPLYLADRITPEVTTPLTAGMEIRIDRSRPVTIVVDGTRIETRTNGQIVLDALAESGVTLSGLDYTIPAEDTAILSGMSIRIIRVTEDLITEEETTSFDTVYQADPELELDQRQVLQAGQNGILQRSIRVRYENGVEISRGIEQETLIQSPVSQVIGYGTNIVLRTINTPDGPVEYWRKLRVYTTSYHPEALGGDNITSVGETLRKGIIGVNPRIIPYYTNMYVEGYGVGFAADTGGPRNNPYWIDLGYEDHDYEQWAGWQDVYLLTPVPENITYLLPVTEQGGPVP